MTKTEFKKLCYAHQQIRNGHEYSEDFDITAVINALQDQDIEFEDLCDHETLKDWMKDLLDREYNIAPLVQKWFDEGLADYYKVSMFMGTFADIIPLATAEDFYNAFEDRRCFEDDGTEWDPFEEDEEEEDNE